MILIKNFNNFSLENNFKDLLKPWPIALNQEQVEVLIVCLISYRIIITPFLKQVRV